MRQGVKMPDKERIKMINDEKELCICGSCPTYNGCAQRKKELLFCLLGKSPWCVVKEIDCVCSGCPVSEQLDLLDQFFDTRGSKKDQRKM
jgi:hypothetical protein